MAPNSQSSKNVPHRVGEEEEEEGNMIVDDSYHRRRPKDSSTTSTAMSRDGIVAGGRNRIRPLHCAAQQYAWGRVGSSSTVARMKGAQVARQADDDGDDDFDDDFEIDETKPYAELWLGTHPNGMCGVTVAEGGRGPETRTLLEYVRSDPMLHCGDGGRNDLTYLLKVLSVRKVLSIQAHPDRRLAERLHAERPKVYKDPNHKPEMAIALSERVRAMCGFRPLHEIVRHLRAYPEFRRLVGERTVKEMSHLAELQQQQTASPTAAAAAAATPAVDQVRACLKEMFQRYMETDDDTIVSLVDTMIKRLKGNVAWKDTTSLQKLILQLNDQFPGDCGIFAPLMFNVVELRKGQGLYIQANEPHAYISGEIIECMACSDNVVRAGLTPKLKDVPTLVGMLTYRTCMPRIDGGSRVDACTVRYRPPVRDFCVDFIDVPPGQSYQPQPVDSPGVLLTIDGDATIRQQQMQPKSANHDDNTATTTTTTTTTAIEYEVSFGIAGFLSANTSCTIVAGPYGVRLTRAYTNVFYDGKE